MNPVTVQTFTRRVRIHLDDVDFAQVLYYPRVADMCCRVLEEFFTDELKLPWWTMVQEHKVGMPTVDLHVVYRRPLRFGDQADVHLTIREVGNRRAAFGFKLVNVATGETTAEVVHFVTFISTATWQAIPIPEPYRSALARWLPA